MDQILKLFPQVVVGTFVTLIGITLARLHCGIWQAEKAAKVLGLLKI